MNYREFKKRIQDRPVFLAKDISLLKEDEQLLRNQIRRWQIKGFLIKLKRDIYLLNEADRKINPSNLFIANQIYAPSYVSLEYALNFYGLIPERVIDITSVTTRKTKQFNNASGVFVYKNLKEQCFSGFTKVKDEAGLFIFIALPEKALVDFFYFNLPALRKDLFAVFKDSFRFQNLSILRAKKILEFAQLFDNRRLIQVCRQFCQFIKKEKI